MKKIDLETITALRTLSNVIGSARSRCNNPANPEYPRYGARGIKVCEQWATHPDDFILWAVNEARYRPGLYLDRVDNDGPYSPENCRFVTPLESTRNRSNVRILKYEGRSQTIMECAEEWGLTYKCLYQRVLRDEPYPHIKRPSKRSVPCSVAAKKSRPLKRGVRK